MLSVLYAAIADELAAINAYVVPLVGEEHVRRNDPPPRMIMYPTEDTPSAPEGPGGNPRPLFTLLKASELVIHGQTTDHVEGMRDQFLIALHKACKKATPNGPRAGRYQVTKGKWTRNTLIAKNGYEYKITFAVAYPVVDRRWETPAPGDPPRPPLPDTYTGDQANTYPTVPGDELTIAANVGVRDNPPAGDNVAINITPAP